MTKSKKGFASRGMVALCAIVSACFLIGHVYGYTVSKQVDNSGTQIRLLDSSGNLTIAGSLTSAGLTTSSGLTVSSGGLTVTAGGLTVTAGGLTITAGGLTAAGVINLGSFTETVTDGAVITNEGRIAILTGTSGGTTNTIANPTGAGEELILLNGSAFSIVFADSGNLSLSGTITLGQDDTLHLVSKTATNWVQVSTSDN